MENQVEEEFKSPEKVITIKVGDEDREVKMTYGLLNSNLLFIKDLTQVSDIYTQETMRNGVLENVLSERDKNGKVTKKVTMEEVELEIETVEEILSWVGGHLTAFFIRSLTKLTQQFPRHLTEEVSPDSPSGSSN